MTVRNAASASITTDPAELLELAAALENQAMTARARAFARGFYGPHAARVTVETDTDRRDALYVSSVTVSNAAGADMRPDLGAPAWAEELEGVDEVTPGLLLDRVQDRWEEYFAPAPGCVTREFDVTGGAPPAFFLVTAAVPEASVLGAGIAEAGIPDASVFDEARVAALLVRDNERLNMIGECDYRCQWRDGLFVLMDLPRPMACEQTVIVHIAPAAALLARAGIEYRRLWRDFQGGTAEPGCDEYAHLGWMDEQICEASAFWRALRACELNLDSDAMAPVLAQAAG